MRGGGDHCSSSRDKGESWNFVNACDVHDLGYDMMRFMRVGGDVRKSIDELFYNEMKANCSRQGFIQKGVCYPAASMYLLAVQRRTSWDNAGGPT